MKPLARWKDIELDAHAEGAFELQTLPSTAPELADAVGQRLEVFHGHSLRDLDKASLMNRVDTKFLVPAKRLPDLLEQLSGDFTALEIDGKRAFRYQSTYFDTAEYKFYLQHHNGQLNRHKVRVRTYLDSDQQFLEIKFKNNKQRTIKRRIKVKGEPEQVVAESIEFLAGAGLPNNIVLAPSLTNRYQRLALASEARGERLTIDFNIENVCHAYNGARAQFAGLAILELKQARVNRTSPFFALARTYGLRPSGFSKYCMGMSATLHSTQVVKTNRFKRILRRLERFAV